MKLIKDSNTDQKDYNTYKKPILEVFFVALRLGLTSFGGLIAHLRYFHDEYIKRRKWMDEQTYAD